MSSITFSVFTKPWKTQPIELLAEKLAKLGFDGIEFPLRAGYQVEPQTAVKALPVLTRTLVGFGLKVTSVAGSLDEPVFEACALAGVPMIRIMANFPLTQGYFATEAQEMAAVAAAVKLSQRYGVKIGVQQHYGSGVANSMELKHFVGEFDPRHVGAIWDAAHSALAGEETGQGLDILWSHLCMVNLKNAFYRRTNGPEAAQAQWERYFTTGSQGLSNWGDVAQYLAKRQYTGTVCLTAEYTDEERVDELIARDIVFAREQFAKASEEK